MPAGAPATHLSDVLIVSMHIFRASSNSPDEIALLTDNGPSRLSLLKEQNMESSLYDESSYLGADKTSTSAPFTPSS